MLLQETEGQLDIDEYDHVVFRVHGDGRKYIANLRTENWLVGGRSHDVWQAFLFARSAIFSVEWVTAMHAKGTSVVHLGVLCNAFTKASWSP